MTCSWSQRGLSGLQFNFRLLFLGVTCICWKITESLIILQLAPSEFIGTAGIIIITVIIIKALVSFHLPSLFSAITALC